MVLTQYSFPEFGLGSHLVKELIQEKEEVRSLLPTFFSREAISKRASEKRFSKERREELVNELAEQNKSVVLTEQSKVNLDSLKDEKTMTITTGHQLNLMTGPLYSIYKIAEVIRLAKEMNQREDGHYYVPLFWMATEDHDFDEINHLYLFGQKVAWEKEGQNEKIVGAIVPEGMETFLEEIESKYKDDELREKIEKLTKIYRNAATLADATRELVNEVFGQEGILVIDGNSPTLKKHFSPIAKREITEGIVFDEVSKTNSVLEENGYHQQVFVRASNLFYITAENVRLRIAKEDDQFTIGEETFSAEELIQKVDERPEAFSPNALLRPVYQEAILPNVVYVGGGGEIAYWLQLRGVFDRLTIDFPLIKVRDSLVLLRDKEWESLQELEMQVMDLKEDVHVIIKERALEEVEIEIELNQEKEDLKAVRDQILTKAEAIQNGLDGMIKAEFAKMENAVDKLEARLIKAEKSKHEKTQKQIERLQKKVFPAGGFQERYDNFLPYFLMDSGFISKIVHNLEVNDAPHVHIVNV